MLRSLSTREFIEDVILKLLPYFYKWDEYKLGRKFTPQELAFAASRHRDANLRMAARGTWTKGCAPPVVKPMKEKPKWRSVEITDEMRADLDGPTPEQGPPPKHLLPILTLAEFLRQEEEEQQQQERPVNTNSDLTPAMRFMMLKLVENPTLSNFQLRDAIKEYNTTANKGKPLPGDTETARDARKAIGITLTGSGTSRGIHVDYNRYEKACKVVGWTPRIPELEKLKGVKVENAPTPTTTPAPTRAEKQVPKLNTVKTTPKMQPKKKKNLSDNAKTLSTYMQERKESKVKTSEVEAAPEKIVAAPVSFTPPEPEPAPTTEFVKLVQQGADAMVAKVEAQQTSVWPDLRPIVRGVLSTQLSEATYEHLKAFKDSVAADGCEIRVLRVRRVTTVEEDLV